MEKAFLTPVRLTAKQEKLCDDHANISRILYNATLGFWNDRYFQRKSQAWFCGVEVKKLKAEWPKLPTYTDFNDRFPWMKKFSSTIRRDAVKNCNSAFKNFFKGLKKGEGSKFPRFKSKNKVKPSFVNYQGNTIKLIDSLNCGFASHIQVPGIGKIRLVRECFVPVFKQKQKVVVVIGATVKFAGDVIQIGFSKRAGQWFCAITLHVPNLPKKELNGSVGLDRGLRTLVACSNGKEYNLGEQQKQSLDQLERQLKRWQRTMSRRLKKGEKIQSKGFEEAKEKVQSIHQRISNIRGDVLHKISHNIVDHLPERIRIEDLNVQGMKKNKKLAPSLQKVGIHEMKRQLEYKAKWRGIKVQALDRFFPSSQHCHGCGEKFKKLKSRKKVVCENQECFLHGQIQDRDLNAAINIENAPDDKFKDLT